jgi:hypothetical protein
MVEQRDDGVVSRAFVSGNAERVAALSQRAKGGTNAVAVETAEHMIEPAAAEELVDDSAPMAARLELEERRVGGCEPAQESRAVDVSTRHGWRRRCGRGAEILSEERFHHGS